MHLVTVATCTLNQWSLDFLGNQERIISSVSKARAAGAKLRTGPELEVPGYGCADHFLEGETENLSWDSLADIITHDECQDILFDVGMPVSHKNIRYNCRIFVLNKSILLIRPKLWLANDGNYREMRWFTPWTERRVEEYFLPRKIVKITGQDKVPFGDALISTKDTCVGIEACEELFTPRSPHISMSLDGAEIFTNSSASHHELRKLNARIDLIREATLKSGGIYLYANQRGVDGDRLYYDGSATVFVNGAVVGQSAQFALEDVELVVATIDLEEIRAYRSSKSRATQSRETPAYQRIAADISLSREAEDIDPSLSPSREIKITYHEPEAEIALGPACYLWDYLRRSRQAGYFIPLSGGIDSCSTAVLVHSMCRLVHSAIASGKNPQVLADLLRITGEDESSTWRPSSPQEIASRIFVTAYMGMEHNSSPATRSRAKALGAAIGSYHLNFDIDSVVNAAISIFTAVTHFTPKYKMYGGTPASNLALQCLQARLRMVLSYFFGQMIPTVRGRTKPGSLLILGSANVDESLRGYLTKYDCSSADINPIGAISKTDLKRFIVWAAKEFELPLLHDFIDAPPTAELEPITDDYVQGDEADMGMSYDELSVYGRLRKVDKLGPYAMWSKLLHMWGHLLSPQEIYEKTRWFFWCYSINRHKMTTLTPSYHAEQYSPDDNRFDLRPFLYPSFTFAYMKIEKALKAMGTVATQKPWKKEVKDE